MRTDEIFNRAIKGNMKAFESLILQYEQLFYSIAYHMMGNTLDAQDMVQEACIKIYKNLSGCQSAAAFKSWACKIVSNTCIDELRRMKNKTAVSLDETICSELLTPEDEAVQSETVMEVRQAIDSLPEQYKILIILRDLEGLSYSELAETLDLSLGVVKSRLFRARSLLKKFLMKS